MRGQLFEILKAPTFDASSYKETATRSIVLKNESEKLHVGLEINSMPKGTHMLEQDGSWIRRLKKFNPKPRPDLSKRIIACAKTYQQETSFRLWDDILSGFTISRPDFSMACMLVIGLFVGVQAPILYTDYITATEEEATNFIYEKEDIL